MGNGVSLVVKVSETPEQREMRSNKHREEDEFLSTLNCAKNLSRVEQRQESDLNQHVTEQIEKNPLLPQYRTLVQTSPEKPKPTSDNVTSATQASLSSSDGAASMRAGSSISEPEFL